MRLRERVLRTSLCVLAAFVLVGLSDSWVSQSTDIKALEGTSWWRGVQQSIASQEYEITWQEGAPGGGAFQAANRAQNLRAYFRADGIELTERAGESDWHWCFELKGFGREGSVAGVGSVEPSAVGRRVEYVRSGVTEWYENSKHGIEQGFVISKRLGGEGAVLLEGSISGDLEARLDEGGGRVSFMCGNREVLRYGALEVVDAEGAEVSSRLELEGEVVGIVIEGEGVYPLYVDPLLTSPSWTAESDQAWAKFGTSVSNAGDVNNDGYSDVIVGAPYYDNGENSEGRAYVYHGGPSGVSTSPSWTAEGDQADAYFGCSVSSAGDVNNDGYFDVIVGADYYDNGQSNEGRAYVYHGGPSGVSANPSWTAEGDQAGAIFGCSVSSAGDVNNDGYSDVIVGARGYNNGQVSEGRAYVYHGGPSGVSTSPSWTAESDQATAWFGVSVSSAGDVNNDGYSDVIVGAEQYDNGENSEGRAYVYHGGPLGVSASSSWTAEGNQAHTFFGHSVSSAGDVNDDGYSDVIVGAIYYDNGQEDEGRAYVYHGGPLGVSTSPSWTAEGDQASACFGSSVSSAGDVNNDGYSDIIVGAHGYGNVQSGEGRAYVYHGGDLGAATSPSWIAESDQESAIFGRSVSRAGDVNNDGCSDVIVGATQYDNGEENEGRAYVYHGSTDDEFVPVTSAVIAILMIALAGLSVWMLARTKCVPRSTKLG